MYLICTFTPSNNYQNSTVKYTFLTSIMKCFLKKKEHPLYKELKTGRWLTMFSSIFLQLFQTIFSHTPQSWISLLVPWQQHSPSTGDSAVWKQSLIHHMLTRKNSWTENYYYYRRSDKHTFTVYHFALGSVVINIFDFFLSIPESLLIFQSSGLTAKSSQRWAGILCVYSNHHFP